MFITSKFCGAKIVHGDFMGRYLQMFHNFITDLYKMACRYQARQHP
jgi:hypothetical protein